MDDLKPCPFCGSHNVYNATGTKANGEPWPYVECNDCSACAEPEFWNRRAQQSAQSVSAVQPVAWTVDDLAQEIRRVDGSHSLGAGALAEALMPFLERTADADAVDAKEKK